MSRYIQLISLACTFPNDLNITSNLLVRLHTFCNNKKPSVNLITFKPHKKHSGQDAQKKIITNYIHSTKHLNYIGKVIMLSKYQML